MDGQPGLGLQWFDASTLCDPARPEMGCSPPPAPKPPAPEPAAAGPFGGFPLLDSFSAAPARPQAGE
jgi:hypothetical protein